CPQVDQIEIGDLQFAARGRPQGPAIFHDTIVVNIESRNREGALGILRLLLEAERSAIGTELDDTVTLWIAHLITENAGAALERERFPIEIEFSVENIVAQDQRGTGVTQEIRPDQERLGDPFRLGLRGILNPNPQPGAIAEIILEHRQVLWSRDDEHIPQSAEHQ